MLNANDTQRVEFHDRVIFRIGGIASLLAGLSLMLTLVYLFGVMTSAGFEMEMFDDPASMLVWAADNLNLYSGLWGLNFLAVFFITPVPYAMYRCIARDTDEMRPWLKVVALFAMVGVIVNVMSVAVLYTVTPITAPAYAIGDNPEMILLIHSIVADIGLHSRLAAEMFLAAWLGGNGYILLSQSRNDILGWYASLFGATLAIAIIGKVFFLFDIEPMMGFFLAIAYVWIGMWLLRVPNPESAPTDESLSPLA